MRHSLRARILAICIAIIVLSLIVIGAATWRVMTGYNDRSIANNLKSIATGHVMAIAEWSDTAKRLVASIGHRALQPDAASWDRNVHGRRGMDGTWPHATQAAESK